MAFWDTPIIDKNAERSEQSILAVRQFINLQSGFLCREEYPDYGVDFVVELRNDKDNASGKQFAIQVKSTQKVKSIESAGQKYVSFSFLTSRLGYLLLRNPPSYGLIIMYDEDSKKCFFDYVEDIVNRITDEHGDEEWKKQEHVNIHLSFQNEITNEIVQSIHQKYTRRFRNTDFMLARHGEDYALPTIKNDSIPVLTIEEFERNIRWLINEQEFSLICLAIQHLGYPNVSKSKLLTLFGAFAFSETGQIAEAKYFWNKSARYKDQFESFEWEIYEFTQLKVESMAGDISLEEMGEKIQALLPRTKNPLNIINLKLNLYVFEVAERSKNNFFEEGFDEELLQFFETIQALDIEAANIHGLVVHHCESVSNYLTSFISYFSIQSKFVNPTTWRNNQERTGKQMARANKIDDVLTLCLCSAIDFANENNDKRLEADGLNQLARTFLQRQFTYALIGSPFPLNRELIIDYKTNRIRFLIAYNTYLDKGLIRDAYLALNQCLDLLYVFHKLYHQELIAESTEEISKFAKSIEDEMNFKPYQSVVREALNKVLDKKNNLSAIDFFENASDEQLMIAARHFLEANNLPEDRLVNILSYFKSHRFFEQKCKNPDIELTQDLRHSLSLDTLFKFPCQYVLFNRKTGVHSLPHTDIDVLLKVFNVE